MALDHVLSELGRVYREQSAQPGFRGVVRLKDADVQQWAEHASMSRQDFYNELATRLARGFASSELTFEFCDSVVNGIHDVIGNAGEARPDLFWRIYGAFDEGEYYHDNNRQEDPAEKYTRPMIADILETLDGRETGLW